MGFVEYLKKIQCPDFDKPLVSGGPCGCSLRAATLWCAGLGLFIGLCSFITMLIVSTTAISTINVLEHVKPEQQEQVNNVVPQSAKVAELAQENAAITLQEFTIESKVYAADIIVDTLTFLAFSLFTILMIFKGVLKEKPIWLIPWLTCLFLDSLTVFSVFMADVINGHPPIESVILCLVIFITDTISLFYGFSYLQEIRNSGKGIGMKYANMVEDC